MVPTKGVHGIQASSSNKALETRIYELTSLVRKLVVGKRKSERLCGICISPEHPTDTCPILQEGVNSNFPQAYTSNIYKPQSNNMYRYNNTPGLSTNRYHPN